MMATFTMARLAMARLAMAMAIQYSLRHLSLAPLLEMQHRRLLLGETFIAHQAQFAPDVDRTDVARLVREHLPYKARA